MLDPPNLTARRQQMVEKALVEAFAASWLAERCGLAHPDRMFSAAMLHDVGHVLALRSLTALQLGGAVEADVPAEVIDGALERTHVELGAEMHVAWTLPAYLTRVCARHHDAVVPDDDEHEIVHVVRVVAGLNALRTRPADAPRLAAPLCQSLRVLGLDRTAVGVVRAQIAQFAERVASLL